MLVHAPHALSAEATHGWDVYCPTAHPAVEQAVQLEVRPDPVEKYPDAHALQPALEFIPVPVWYVPGPHMGHDSPSPALYLPTGQYSWQDVSDPSPNCPAAHTLHPASAVAAGSQ
jgi:hypothetical protein